ncbi:FxDxF family PEP-CTERM protein [Pseudoduganella sp. SL102]|uniref:FxDxF family PEP-CTERM protein n=1 Tax=Pseudoduganella sp. SL102 TaxID=2995154 RepID=UPI00248AD7FF|nr:FxDxF family PEP-CTERM protein [Pseudoduganella sp. SL102]WBS04505.1 FxDxF family PEP-CTERM protein [Pseudoduganella sp. SL102]
MKLKFAVASLLAAVSMSSFAADQTIVLDADGTASFFGTPTLLEGGSDVLTFTGLAAGTYEVLITLSGQYLSFNQDATTLNGVNAGVWTATSGSIKKTVSFGSVDATTTSPFVLNLAGALTDAKLANYSGEISVSPVPEPATYGMLLGGLGIMGFLARRKSKQA